ncbi:MAG TPA: HD-GYP domain-containing protein, partial [Candidatus Acetothermia bacterium]|nr:HD-GYP domain-containing protein [Candidatus Acetothermia bacterium]
KVPLRDKSGRIIGISGFATEITDEIRIRDQLAHLNQTLRAIEADAARHESEELYCDITERMAAEKALKDSYEKLERTLEGIVEALGAAIELRDPYTAGHQRRVAELAVAIAEEMGLPTEKVEATRYAALVHDIGKLAVPAEILAKPAALTDTEFSLIKFHPQQAYDILKEIDFPWPLAEIVLQHHERLDGSGYPNGLKGDEILLEARIIAVADVVEAMSSHRPYRPALGIEAACDEIKAKRGRLYDPDVVDACVSLFEKGFSFA